MEKPIESLRRIYTDGRHNAFPSLCRFHGQLFLSFRASTGHAVNDGVIKLLRSRDEGNTWEEIPTPFHDRGYWDGWLVVFKDKLFLFSGSLPDNLELPVWCYLNRMHYAFSEDGVHWSRVGEICPYPSVRFWRPIVWNNRLYVCDYRTSLRIDRPALTEVELLSSEDGRTWKYISSLNTGTRQNETAIIVRNGVMQAFLRNEAPDSALVIRSSTGAFTEWEDEIDTGISLLGPMVRDINGRRFLFGRWRGADMPVPPIDRSTVRLRAYTVDPADSHLELYAEFPSAFDCSYADAVPLDDQHMLVTYYSQHEHACMPDFKDMHGFSDIFLAVVRTDN